MASVPIRLLIVDDHPLIREALKRLLADIREISIIDDAVNGREAIEIVKSSAIDVILMDLIMPEVDGIVATKYITHHFPQVKILGLTLHDEQCYITEMLAAGALGFLTKTVDKTTLIQAIKTVNGGNPFLHTV